MSPTEKDDAVVDPAPDTTKGVTHDDRALVGNDDAVAATTPATDTAADPDEDDDVN